MIRDIQTRIFSKLLVLSSMDPIFFESNSSSDERGTVSFTNDLNLQKAVRTYKVENSQLKTVRAWHGHKIEEKWVKDLSKYLNSYQESDVDLNNAIKRGLKVI